MKKEDLETYKFVKANKILFDDVQKESDRVSNAPKSEIYTILNYRRIIGDLCDYLEGYMDYADSDNNKKYGNTILAKTAKFYDSMFYDKRYRMKFTLPDFVDVSEDYLERTKELQDLMLKIDNIDDELHAMLIMTNNQYRKLSKVFKDDIQIWMWLSGIRNHENPPTDLRQKFLNKSTPCIHKK
jgi:hypothetical protein